MGCSSKDYLWKVELYLFLTPTPFLLKKKSKTYHHSEMFSAGIPSIRYFYWNCPMKKIPNKYWDLKWNRFWTFKTSIWLNLLTMLFLMLNCSLLILISLNCPLLILISLPCLSTYSIFVYVNQNDQVHLFMKWCLVIHRNILPSRWWMGFWKTSDWEWRYEDFMCLGWYYIEL